MSNLRKFYDLILIILPIRFMSQQFIKYFQYNN